jgi:hypothetical protein
LTANVVAAAAAAAPEAEDEFDGRPRLCTQTDIPLPPDAAHHGDLSIEWLRRIWGNYPSITENGNSENLIGCVINTAA